MPTVQAQPGVAAFNNPKPLSTQPRPILTRGSDVIPTATEWLWPGWIAAGKLHLLAGPPGTGKTTIAAAWAATVSHGGHWPCGNQASAGDVIIWSGEDGNADTLNPRLRAADADMTRIFTIDGMSEGARYRPFDPVSDFQHLSEVLSRQRVKLLIIDPIVAVVVGDSHKNAEVRRSLQPLVDLAAASGVAVIGITHLSKGTQGRDPVERITGSLAFGAVARLAYMTAVEQEEDPQPAMRRLVRIKSNIGPDGDGFQYRIKQRPLADFPDVETSTISWVAPLVGDARRLLGVATDAQAATRPREEALQFLKRSVIDSPVPVELLKQMANDAGLAWRTIERAKSELGIVTLKKSMAGGWSWELPP